MAERLLEVKNVTKTFEDGVRAVDRASFHIDAGESVGLVGESGSGKSTMARLISGLIRPEIGTIQIYGKDVSDKRKAKKNGCLVNMIFQDPEASFDPRMTVYRSLYEALIHTGKYSKKEADALIDDALHTVNLELEFKQRRVSMLSGGQCQRVAIARTMLTKPELFICDEATSALDVSVQAQIVDLFVKLQKERTFSYLFISHDLALVACLCTRVVVMFRGHIVEQGPAKEILQNPSHPYTRLLVNCAEAFTVDQLTEAELPEVPQGEEMQSAGCNFYPYCSRRQAICCQREPESKEMMAGWRTVCHFPINK